MKKSFKVAFVTTLAVGVFSAGFFGKDVYTKATSDWKTNVINQANSELGSVAYSKKEELKASAVEDINAKVQDELSGDIESQKAELERLLEEYYQMKLNGLSNTSDFKTIEAQIATIKESILKRYQDELDAVFAAQAK
jgi:ribosomal protein L29